MRVIATAGHVDHGKSTLVRLLTGMEPDRWAEERRRGLTIDLGFAWTTLPSGEQVALVDVPGHQRFVPNMLAGLGPVPAVLLVIAADQGWQRQTTEHLDAIEALQIEHGVLAISRADLADAAQIEAVIADARGRLARSSLGAVPAVPVSGLTGAGSAELREAIARMVAGMPEPARTGRARLWIDRSFTVKGAGTVVTGTLAEGRLAVGDELELRGVRYPVRGLQSLGSPVEQLSAVARVAVNLRGLARGGAARGDCLLSPDRWLLSDRWDVRLEPLLADPVTELVLHVGSASVPVRVRRLTDEFARLTLATAVPAQVGDRAVLRDPGQQSIVAGVQVLDPDPPPLTRRGAALERAAELAAGLAASVPAQVRRRGAVRRAHLAALGLPVDEAGPVLARGDWLIDPASWRRWAEQLALAVDEQARRDPRRPWLAAGVARQATGLPELGLLPELAADADLDWADGRLSRPGSQPSATADGGLQQLLARLELQPFGAPEQAELAALGLDRRDLAVAERAGRLLRLAPELVVAADAADRAVRLLAELAQPFTLSQARQQLGTTRRVAVPLLEWLDRAGRTVRVDEQRRSLR